MAVEVIVVETAALVEMTALEAAETREVCLVCYETREATVEDSEACFS